MSAIILKPKDSEKAYLHAADAFCRLYTQVTGREIAVTDTDDGVSDLIVIGSDAVNDFVAGEVLELRIESLGIRYGTDDYCIRSHKQGGRKTLILAGGRGRSTLYAVYDYFERFAGCHYFWDGDVIPHRDDLPMDDIDIVESPRFEYRGLRYFAHRGLKRFQAEHWSFEDWKRELDWMTKRRLNFFMLRIGMDDVWQRAFPDDVPYPDGYRTITGVDAEGFNDRTDFWTLKYRGELRIKILEYARELDLIYPTDCGTMTHWYSRTPESFLENKKPDFCIQEIAQYTASDTGRVFDFTKKECMDYYMHLTETMVKEHEKQTGLFHTIGLGERRMFTDPKKNLALKLIAYRRIAQNIRTRFPDAKLMLASWDFVGWWTSKEMQTLIGELDPAKTIVLDYTSEVDDPDVSFLSWGVVKKFPWVFGLFHAYESDSELRGPYDRSDARLKIAMDDPYCQGMILWPELSHSDPLVLEYLAHNSWKPLEKTVEELLKNFCYNRYGEYADTMNESWQQLLPFIKLNDWGGYSRRTPDDEKYLDYMPKKFLHHDQWAKPIYFLKRMDGEEGAIIEQYFDIKKEQYLSVIDQSVIALDRLTSMGDAFDNKFILRDAVDLTRTVLGRMISLLLVKCWKVRHDENQFKTVTDLYFDSLKVMGALLSVNPDFSIYQSLKELEKVSPVNPDFEVALKRNIYNRYCAQPAYELTMHYFDKLGKAVFDYMQNPYDIDKAEIEINRHFESIPLESMQPTEIPFTADAIKNAIECIKTIARMI